MPIFVPDLFSGYLQGRRAAIQDNWNDLTNYNKTLGGQLQNAMSMETFDDAARIAHNRAALSDMGRVQGALDTQLGLQTYALGQQANLPQMEIDARIVQLEQIRARADQEIANLQQQKAQQATPIEKNVGTQTTKSTTNPTSTSATTALETTGVAASPNNPLG